MDEADNIVEMQHPKGLQFRISQENDEDSARCL